MLQPFSDDDPQHFFTAESEFLGDAAYGFFDVVAQRGAEEGKENLILIATWTKRRRTTATKTPIGG